MRRIFASTKWVNGASERLKNLLRGVSFQRYRSTTVHGTTFQKTSTSEGERERERGVQGETLTINVQGTARTRTRTRTRTHAHGAVARRILHGIASVYVGFGQCPMHSSVTVSAPARPCRP